MESRDSSIRSAARATSSAYKRLPIRWRLAGGSALLTLVILLGFAAIVGHARPIFLKFEKGGKAVATTGGMMIGLAPLVALCALIVWIVTFVVARYVSVASMAAALSLPVFAFVLAESWPVRIVTFLAAGAILFLHRENIKRLFAHREPRVQLAAMFRR